MPNILVIAPPCVGESSALPFDSLKTAGYAVAHLSLDETESDAIEIPLEVVPHGLKQTAGGALTLSGDNDEKTISLNLPPDAHSQARSLRIEASPAR